METRDDRVWRGLRDGAGLVAGSDLHRQSVSFVGTIEITDLDEPKLGGIGLSPGGIVRVGQKGPAALPAGIVTTVKQIWTYDGPVPEAFCPQSVTLVLEHDIDISRGQHVDRHRLPPARSAAAEIQAEVCWMHPRALQPGRKKSNTWKHTTHTVQAVVTDIVNKLNVSHARLRTLPCRPSWR